MSLVAGARKSRKSRKRHDSSSAGRSCPVPPALPRVTTAPAAISASPAPAKSVESMALASRGPLADDAGLKGQIATLTQIFKYGYGPVPGSPSKGCRAASTAPSSVRRQGGDFPPRACRNEKFKRAGRSDKESHIFSKTKRSWCTKPTACRGASEGLSILKEGPSLKTADDATIERDEFRTARAQREAAARGRSLLWQLDRVLQRKDLTAVAQMLKSARAEFSAAGDTRGTDEVDCTLLKVKLDLTTKAIAQARAAREFDRMQVLTLEAQYCLSLLAHFSRGGRHDTVSTSEQREMDRRTYESLRHPRRRCREHALNDGRKSMKVASAQVRKRKYDKARLLIEDARKCFTWAGEAEEDMKGLERVRSDLEVRERCTRGDKLTEHVADKLQFLTPKDYERLFAQLAGAADAYGEAHDKDGAQVAELVRSGLCAIESAESCWVALVGALKERRYPDAVGHLQDAKRFLQNATRGLPFVSPSLNRAIKILSPAGGLTPLDIVAELTAVEGVQDHSASTRALEQGELDEAQELNTSAREILEFTARSCGRRGVQRGTGADNESPVQGVSAMASGQDAISASYGGEASPPHYAPSEDERRAGHALLLKIRDLTSPPIVPDMPVVQAKSRITPRPGVRDHVEDLLDAVSEAEDIITRRKALERGDKLMSLYQEVVDNDLRKPAIPAVSADVSRSLEIRGGTHEGQEGTRLVMHRANPSCERAQGDPMPVGVGDALSPQAATECLRLLADASDAYQGQGFVPRGQHAARLRAGILADRRLATAAALARESSAAAAAAIAPEVTSADAGKLFMMDKMETARVAAREAEDNYVETGSATGALKARQIVASLRGDEALMEMAPLLDRRDYFAALKRMHRSRSLYNEAGPEGADGLERTAHPEAWVKAVAVRDGRRLKAAAIEALREGNVPGSTDLRRQAQSCFSFADHRGLANATADVDAAVAMVTNFTAGDAVVAVAETTLEEGLSDRAAELLCEAKSCFHAGQVSYENLVSQVTSLLECPPDDRQAVRKAMELQDNINSIYDSRKDGSRVAKVESRLDCLAADASLQDLAQVLDHELFEDARILLAGATQVYEQSGDTARVTKVTRMKDLVGRVEEAVSALDAGRYEDAEHMVAESLRERSALAHVPPLSLRVPESTLFQGGEDGAKTAVLLRVRTTGEAARAKALRLLEEQNCEAAESAAASACARLEWWAEYGGAEGQGHGSDDERHAVVREAQELRRKAAAAAGRAKAEGRTKEGREMKAVGNFDGAASALLAAAKLFEAAGMASAAAIAGAEASQTRAEALLLTAEKLHESGDLEAVAGQLETAEDLLVEAGELVLPVAHDDDHDVSKKSGLGSPLAGAQSCREGLCNLRTRVAGDLAMRGVLPALESKFYDQALQLMLEADRHYGTIKKGKWTASAVDVALKSTAGGTPGASAAAAPASPKYFVVKRAAQDSDELKARAAVAIQRERDPAKARGLLAQAEACMAWAGIDPIAAGAGAVAKDIQVYECRAAGDDISRDLAPILRAKDLLQAEKMLEGALIKYRDGDAFKQIADTRAVMFCVERESSLCRGLVDAISADDATTAVKMLEESAPVFKIAADMTSQVLKDAIEIMGTKSQHLELLRKFCKEWAKCVQGADVNAEFESAETLGDLMMTSVSDLHHLIASGAVVLDISPDVAERARDRAMTTFEASVVLTSDQHWEATASLQSLGEFDDSVGKPELCQLRSLDEEHSTSVAGPNEHDGDGPPPLDSDLEYQRSPTPRAEDDAVETNGSCFPCPADDKAPQRSSSGGPEETHLSEEANHQERNSLEAIERGQNGLLLAMKDLHPVSTSKTLGDDDRSPRTLGFAPGMEGSKAVAPEILNLPNMSKEGTSENGTGHGASCVALAEKAAVATCDNTRDIDADGVSLTNSCTVAVNEPLGYEKGESRPCAALEGSSHDPRADRESGGVHAVSSAQEARSCLSLPAELTPPVRNDGSCSPDLAFVDDRNSGSLMDHHETENEPSPTAAEDVTAERDVRVTGAPLAPFAINSARQAPKPRGDDGALADAEQKGNSKEDSSGSSAESTTVGSARSSSSGGTYSMGEERYDTSSESEELGNSSSSNSSELPEFGSDEESSSHDDGIKAQSELLVNTATSSAATGPLHRPAGNRDDDVYSTDSASDARASEHGEGPNEARDEEENAEKITEAASSSSSVPDRLYSDAKAAIEQEIDGHMMTEANDGDIQDTQPRSVPSNTSAALLRPSVEQEENVIMDPQAAPELITNEHIAETVETVCARGREVFESGGGRSPRQIALVSGGRPDIDDNACSDGGSWRDINASTHAVSYAGKVFPDGAVPTHKGTPLSLVDVGEEIDVGHLRERFSQMLTSLDAAQGGEPSLNAEAHASSLANHESTRSPATFDASAGEEGLRDQQEAADGPVLRDTDEVTSRPGGNQESDLDCDGFPSYQNAEDKMEDDQVEDSCSTDNEDQPMQASRDRDNWSYGSREDTADGNLNHPRDAEVGDRVDNATAFPLAHPSAESWRVNNVPDEATTGSIRLKPEAAGEDTFTNANVSVNWRQSQQDQDSDDLYDIDDVGLPSSDDD